MRVHKGNKFDSMKKIEKQSNPKVMNLFMMIKSTLKRFGFIKPSSGLYDGEKFLLEQRWMFLLKSRKKRKCI